MKTRIILTALTVVSILAWIFMAGIEWIFSHFYCFDVCPSIYPPNYYPIGWDATLTNWIDFTIDASQILAVFVWLSEIIFQLHLGHRRTAMILGLSVPVAFGVSVIARLIIFGGKLWPTNEIELGDVPNAIIATGLCVLAVLLLTLCAPLLNRWQRKRAARMA
jgi:hypothetical protein